LRALCLFGRNWRVTHELAENAKMSGLLEVVT
jgi:hypothetical protein